MFLKFCFIFEPFQGLLCSIIYPILPYNFHAKISSNAVFPLPGYDDEKSLLMSQKSLEKRFGQSPVFIAATFMEQGGIPPSTNPATLLKEAIHVISCGYEDKTEWGKEVSCIFIIYDPSVKEKVSDL